MSCESDYLAHHAYLRSLMETDSDDFFIAQSPYAYLRLARKITTFITNVEQAQKVYTQNNTASMNNTLVNEQYCNFDLPYIDLRVAQTTFTEPQESMRFTVSLIREVRECIKLMETPHVSGLIWYGNHGNPALLNQQVENSYGLNLNTHFIGLRPGLILIDSTHNDLSTHDYSLGIFKIA